MTDTMKAFCATVLMIGLGFSAHAGDAMFENFENRPETRWQYIADTVMGGVSTGNVQFSDEAGKSFARLAGNVSTENRGGFIQFRRKLDTSLPADTKGIRLLVRGNGQQYFVHLRTKGTLLPWQYYQAAFETDDNWTEIRLPLTSFEPSGRMLRATPAPTSLTSVGIVAYGRDHEAQVDVREVGF
ncbi:MAG: CIA30 family protein [Pseudomonadota bacterium]